MGVERFFVVDNASEDGTAELLLAQDDVHVFHTDASYGASRCGVDWLNELLGHYGTGCWSLTLDPDELLLYPLSEEVSLSQLTRFLDERQVEGLVTFMLDMYSPSPIVDTVYEAGAPFLSVCKYFDVDTYHERDASGVPVRGGPRHRLFWEGRNRPKPSPVLKKIPLVKWRRELRYEASTHAVSNVRLLVGLTGVLMHFKFFSDFYACAEVETARKEHWDSAAQYASYWSLLENNPRLTAFFERSVEFEGTMQLVNRGMLQMPREYLSEFRDVAADRRNND